MYYYVIFLILSGIAGSLSFAGACPPGSAWLDEAQQARLNGELSDNVTYRRGCRTLTPTGQFSWTGQVELIGTKNVVIHSQGNLNTVRRWMKNGELHSRSSEEVLVYSTQVVGLGRETYNHEGKLDGSYSVDGELGQYKNGFKVGFWRQMQELAPGYSAQTHATLYDDQGHEMETYEGSAIKKKIVVRDNVKTTTTYLLSPNRIFSVVEETSVKGQLAGTVTSLFHPVTGRLWGKIEKYPYFVGSVNFTTISSIYDATETGNLVLWTNETDRLNHLYDPQTTLEIDLSKPSSFLHSLNAEQRRRLTSAVHGADDYNRDYSSAIQKLVDYSSNLDEPSDFWITKILKALK